MVYISPSVVYAFGMYLMRNPPGDETPDFMRFLSWTELPWYWVGTEHFAWAMILVLSVPALVAFFFGFFCFPLKIKVCISQLLPQAMTFAAALLFFRNETGFGGKYGFTGFKTLLGFDITSAPMRATLCFILLWLLMLCFIGLRQLMNRPYGRVLARFVTVKTVCNIWVIVRCGTSFQHGCCRL